YYSNNALENIGWMNTVVDIMPELFKSDEERNNGKINENEIDLKYEKDDNIYENEMNSKSETYAYHAQKLFYNPCFCNKSLDLLSFEFLEIYQKSNDLLKVFIPITQLIPQDSELYLQEIDYDKIVDIRMVPLTDFTTKKKSLLNVKKSKLTRFLDVLIFPSQYLSYEDFKEKDYSPFIRLIMELIKKGKIEILYENPSIGAAMNWMLYSSKFYFPRALCLFSLYFLTYSIFSWAYISHVQITGTLQLMMVTTIVLFYYLAYVHIVVEFNQFRRQKMAYFTDPFNMDGFKNVESSQFLTFIIFLSYPYYIGLSQSSTTYEITNGNAVYTMTGEVSDNPFSSIIGAILAVHDWSSISLDTWNFWPLTIISVIGCFIFVIILQNVIISFMSDAFSDAAKDSKRGVYGFQVKLRAKYICFYDDPSITKSWKKKSEKMQSKPYPKMPKLRKIEFKSWPVERCEFIWKKENKEQVTLKNLTEEFDTERYGIIYDTEPFPYSLIHQ
ncbi:35724_t:CDS:2, partial [Racocetra persica]